MIDINFLNVNQGDSLIIDYKDDSDERRVIIVDCNRTTEGNKTIDWLVDNKISEVSTIVLSHWHHDHYSGMQELLEFCNTKGIRIRRVLLTGKVNPNYVRQITRASDEASNDANRLLNLIITYQKAEFLSYSHIEETGALYPLYKDVTLQFLSPSSREEIEYGKSIKVESYANSDVKNHPAANYLSTVIKIEGKDWFVLLTGDALKFTLVRLDKEEKVNPLNKRFILGQVSHHGGLSSHNNTFWRKASTVSMPKIVFSVGDNIYKHPHKDVVGFFRENGYELFSTNEIGSLKLIEQGKSALVTSHLSTFSSLSTKAYSDPKLNGDKYFRIDSNGSVTLI